MSFHVGYNLYVKRWLACKKNNNNNLVVGNKYALLI